MKPHLWLKRLPPPVGIEPGLLDQQVRNCRATGAPKIQTGNTYKLNINIFIYKTAFFHSINNPNNLDPSYKMDLDLWDCLGRVKLILS